MSFFIQDAVAQTAAPAAQGSTGPAWLNFVLLGGLFLFMYFIVIRPQKKKQKEHEALTSGLSKGDEVVTTGGLLGKIVDVDESYVSLDVSNNVQLKFQKIAIHAVLPKGTIKKI